MDQVGTVKIDDNFGGEWISATTNNNNNNNNITVLYLHGGAYCYLHPANYRMLIGRISKALGGARCFAPDYRLAPEHPFPAAVHDCVASYQFLREKQGIDPRNIVLVGDSAGGGLVIATLLFLRDEQQNTPLPNRAICISPWIDLRTEPTSYRQHIDSDIFGSNGLEVFVDCANYYAGGNKKEDKLISPITTPSLAGLPPILIQAGSCEQLLSNSLDLEKKCKKDGVAVTLVVYTEMYHDFQLSTHPDAQVAIDEIAAFASSK